ncbi:MAG: 50S ribosomal protein L29 [Bradymonadaceae bacterium]|nr:50S ribosomal protein L29 [Lujinxingiaceae bacterium]
MKAAQLKDKTEQELRALETQLRDELFRLRLKQYTGQLRRTSELEGKRRDIARVKTILNQRNA